MFFLQLKIIFQTPVPLVLIKLCIYKDEFTPIYYYQYQVNSQPENVENLRKVTHMPLHKELCNNPESK